MKITDRSAFSLANFARVAWAGEPVEIAPQALQKMEESRAAFMHLLESDPDLTIYGVTSGYGQNASIRLTGQARRDHAANPPFSPMIGFGGDLPNRLKRGIVFCRLTNFIEGHAAVTPALACSVAAMLDDVMQPRVPLSGNTSAGEIIPLSHLFATLGLLHDFAEKESLALINGSPCATALLADIALSTEVRLQLVLDVFALSIEALGAPLEAYDEALQALYGDSCTAWALQSLRDRIDLTNRERRSYQAPVSWRIQPQVLGQATRAHAQLRELAECSLKAVTDNPVFMQPDTEYPLGRVLSNGGYHNGGACAAMNAVAASFADLALLCDRQVSKLFDGAVSGLPAQLQSSPLAGSEDVRGYLGCAGFVAADFAEQARRAAERTPLVGSEGGGFGQNDVLNPVFHAWRQCDEAGRALDACLAVLAVTCSQAFHVSDRSRCPETLAGLLEQIRFLVPPLDTPRAMGFSIGDLANTFSAQVYAHCTTDKKSVAGAGK